MKANENHMATVFIILSIALIYLLVLAFPDIGIAPLESMGQRLIRLAIFTGYWPLAIYFLGGHDFNIIEIARENENLSFFGILLAAIIVGSALVLGK